MMLPRTSSPLDSGFRRNDVGRGNDVGGVVVHHGNHSPIMAIMVQRIPPSRSVRGLGRCSAVIPAARARHSERKRACHSRAGGDPSF